MIWVLIVVKLRFEANLLDKVRQFLLLNFKTVSRLTDLAELISDFLGAYSLRSFYPRQFSLYSALLVENKAGQLEF